MLYRVAEVDELLQLRTFLLELQQVRSTLNCKAALLLIKLWRILIMSLGAFFTPNFGKRSGSYQHPGFRPEQYLPPMAPDPGQVNFDYSPLFIAEHLVMDKEAFGVLVSSESPLPAQALEQLKALHDEEFIRLEDYTPTAEERTRIADATDAELQKGGVWDLPVSRSINWWFNANRHFGSGYRKHMDRLGGLPYLITEYQARRKIYYDIDLGCSFWKTVKKAKISDSVYYEEVMAELRGILLDYINTSLILAERLSSSNYEWHNYQAALTQKLKGGSADVRSRSPGYSVRALVQAVVPCDFPLARTANAIRLLKDRRIKNVREVLAQAANYHGGVNDALRRDFYQAVCEAEHISARRRKFGYFTASLGAVLGLPGVGVAADSAGAWMAEEIYGNAEVASDLLKEGAEFVAGEAVGKAVAVQKPSRRKMAKAAMVIYRHYRGSPDKLL